MPYEVIWITISNLNFDDTVCLSRTCKRLHFLLNDERICRSISEMMILSSKEVLSANGSFSRAVRRVAKRRDAFANAHPFSVAIVGFGESYLYCNGVLSYLLGAEIRVLQLHVSKEEEIIISISGLMQTLLSEDKRVQKSRLQFLYYNEGILCFLLEILELETGDESWIIAICINDGTVLLNERLEVTEKIFVRHNGNYLYYGTHSERDVHNNKRWVIRGYQFRERSWFDECIHLSEMVGSDIGSTISFEFHDGFFYALSSETSDEPEEVDWTSFYHCFRFPLESPSPDLLEATDNKSMWRRQHSEGPIDDRWTCLQLDSDEESNKLRIIEARREWPMGGSRSRRTFYIANIKFPDKKALPASNSETKSSRPNLSDLPNDQLLATLTSSDNPHYLKPEVRLPQNVHPGDDDYSRFAFVLNKTKVRHYNFSANAYLDLVDDPDVNDWQAKQRLKIRVGGRKPRPLQPLTESSSSSPQMPLCEPTTGQPTDHPMYQYNPIQMWPPEKPEFDELYELLNPSSHLGNVHGTADERSLVYCTGGNSNQAAAIVFINFDPAIKLSGIKKWFGPGIGEGPYIDGRATGNILAISTENAKDQKHCKLKGKVESKEGELIARPTDTEKQQIVMNEPHGHLKDGGKVAHGSYMQCDGAEKQTNWLWIEEALYKSIDRGFWLGAGVPS